MRWEAPRDAPVERDRLEATAAVLTVQHSSVPPIQTLVHREAAVRGCGRRHARRTPPSMTSWLSRAPAARRVV
jgi:hypothetical protein